MAGSALTGEMKTKITFKSKTTVQDIDGYPQETWEDVFNGRVWCKWVNAYGQELYANMQLGLNETATITMRYSNKIDVRCEIYKENDQTPYEIVCINDVLENHQFLEIKVKRKVVT